MKAMKRAARMRPWLILGVMGLPGAAMGHESYITTVFNAASASRLEAASYFQYGFTQHSPWLLRGEAAYLASPGDTLAGDPQDHSFQWGAGLGWEGKHLGLSVRGGTHHHSYTDSGGITFGASLMVRFVTLVRLWGQETDLTLDDRNDILKNRLAERESKLLLAPELTVAYDQFTLSDPLGTSLTNVDRIAVNLRWKFEPWFHLIPSYEGFVYTSGGLAPDLSRAAAASPTFRPSRIPTEGPHAWTTLNPGGIASVMRVTSQWGLTHRNAATVSIQRVTTNPGRTFGGVHLAWHRRIDQAAEWVLTPGFEHLRSGSDHLSAFSVSVSYNPTSPYAP
ncbi:MAG: hypothetical protein IT285_05195 [Bdellovibrionales bacterium]|nr:hypothetical protein [Bdellovibrionales bacterium]